MPLAFIQQCHYEIACNACNNYEYRFADKKICACKQNKEYGDIQKIMFYGRKFSAAARRHKNIKNEKLKQISYKVGYIDFHKHITIINFIKKRVQCKVYAADTFAFFLDTF